MSAWKNWFNIKIIREKEGLVGGLAVRVLGLDVAIGLVLDPRQWALVHLQVLNAATRCLLLAESGPALFYAGRSDALWSTSPE